MAAIGHHDAHRVAVCVEPFDAAIPVGVETQSGRSLSDGDVPQSDIRGLHVDYRWGAPAVPLKDAPASGIVGAAADDHLTVVAVAST